jgi:E3 ubiquitin-protein ligase NEDD4
LGVINIQVGNVFDVSVGGDGRFAFFLCKKVDKSFEHIEMLTLDLKKSNSQESIQGKLILNMSTNVNVPIRNGTNTLTQSSRNSVAQSSTHSAETSSNAPSSNLPPPPSINSTNTRTDDSRNHDLPEG